MKKQLTVFTDKTDKETIHCELDITGSELTWTSGKWAATWENQQCGFWPGLTQTRLYSYWRWLEAGNFVFREVEGLYYPSSENKGADQLRSNREADLRLCFRICRLLVFSWRGSNEGEILAIIINRIFSVFSNTFLWKVMSA